MLPVSPLAHFLGFGHLRLLFYLAVALMVAAYLTLAELIKQWFFYGRHGGPSPVAVPGGEWERRIQRRAFRWSHREALW